MACRVAGANNVDELWQSILNKKDASGEIPPMRWEPYLRRDIRNAKQLQKVTSRGYFINNLEDFDAAFFGISPKEAEQMDPQQRLSLEVTWEALENAGIAPQDLSGSDTAVFMGVNSDDYSKLLLEDLPGVEAWMGIGTAYCGVPNRISYHMNLMGPSTAVDAACASSLVAIHHGRQAILQGESKVAIAGGVNALCGPGLTSVLDRAGAICPEGNCLSFDDNAHGYGRGEGAGVVILKRMADALADGDNIVAILKGTAVAQDGRTNGIMAPNAKAQELVAKNALRVAKVDPKTVRYIEAHATSTPLGDPTEISAISSVYGIGRMHDDPCYIGSVKPNIGHLEAGAGVMGFIKAILAVKKSLLPPQTNLIKLNSKVDWDTAGVKVVQEATDWPFPDEIRRASICSYGYGGTVSHAVIESYPRDAQYHIEVEEKDRPARPLEVLLFSAPQERRLAIQAETYASWISSNGQKYDLQSIASTMATRRGHHDYRAALVVENYDEASKLLGAFGKGNNTDLVVTGRVLGSEVERDPVWVFSGHGAQWKEMGKSLLQEPVFFKTVSSLDCIIHAEMDFSAIQALKDGDFETSDRIQVLTYVVQVGLTLLLKSKGLSPQAVIGHSVGEIAASVAAGCLTPVEGALVICKRAYLYRRVMGLGAMILVNAPFTTVEEELRGRQDIVAAINSSPSSCVVSGEKDAVQNFAENLKTRMIKTFRVKSDIAFHSPMLNDLVDSLSKSLADLIAPQPPTIKLYSSSDADPRSSCLRDIAYWTNNMIKPVLLTSAVCAAVEDGSRIFLEVSTHPIVAHSINETLMDKGIEDSSVVSTMSRGKPALKTILASIAQLYCRGADVDFKALTGEAWVPDFPTTTWSHKPVWRKIETGPLGAGTTHDVEKHTLLGQRIPIAGESTILYTTKIDNATKPFPGNHPLHGTEIVPAAALVNTFHHATSANTLSNIVLRVPVAINAPRDLQVVVQQDQIKIASRLINEDNRAMMDLSWVTHTTGHWSREAVHHPDPPTIDIEAIKARVQNKLKDNFTIDYLDKVGVSAMGFPWAVIEHYGTNKEMIAKVDVAPDVGYDTLPWDAHSWAPILDAATSVGSTLFFDDPRLRMPAQIDKVVFYSNDPPPKVGYLHVEEATDTALAVHVAVTNEAGNVLAKFSSIRFSEIEGTPGVSGSVESLVHQLAWPPASFVEKPLQVSMVILLCNDTTTMQRYAASIPKSIDSTVRLNRAQELVTDKVVHHLSAKGTIIVYMPGQVQSQGHISEASEDFISELLDTVKLVASRSLPSKVFVLTDRVFAAANPTALAQAPLHGLGRIIASEQPDAWGGLIDNEDYVFPIQAMKYVQDQDVVRIGDGIPRTARLRSLPHDSLLQNTKQGNLMPRPEGTYVITGGLGALGLEIADFLVEKGARRLILMSRRGLPPRSQWSDSNKVSTDVVQKIKYLEDLGATINIVALDIGATNGAAQLEATLERLSVPPVLGVVHAAGVLEDQLVLETTADSFHRVLAPKIAGALNLHTVFPPQCLDFFILFSSCGQLFGFPGQSSYASANAFLDSLATHRRSVGDNAVAFQWTSWRGLGMAASTDFINAELESKGITDVTTDEAFRAWMHLAKYDMDHGVVLRSMAFDEGEPLPVPILNDIAVRRSAPASSSSTSGPAGPADDVPKSGPELKTYLDIKIRECVAKVLQLSGIDDVDSRAALSDLGLDSVMTVSLRRQLQQTIKVKVPPTLTWSHPTVGHLVGWFAEKMTT